MWRFDAAHQASEAERGRLPLMGPLFLLLSDKVMSSLFLNRKIPFHAEPGQEETPGLKVKELWLGS